MVFQITHLVDTGNGVVIVGLYADAQCRPNSRLGVNTLFKISSFVQNIPSCSYEHSSFAQKKKGWKRIYTNAFICTLLYIQILCTVATCLGIILKRFE